MKVRIHVAPFSDNLLTHEKISIWQVDKMSLFSFSTLMNGMRISEEWNHDHQCHGWFHFGESKKIIKLVALLFQIFDYLGIEYEYSIDPRLKKKK